jgi:hypothetical protein
VRHWSKVAIRRIIKDEDALPVSFADHDGYMRVNEPTLRRRVLEAQRELRTCRPRPLNPI